MENFRRWFVGVFADAVSDDRVFATITRVDSKPVGAVIVEGVLTGPAALDLLALRPAVENEFLSLENIGTITVVLGADTGAAPPRAEPSASGARSPKRSTSGSGVGGAAGGAREKNPSARRSGGGASQEVFDRLMRGVPSIAASAVTHGSLEWFEMMAERGSVSGMDGAPRTRRPPKLLLRCVHTFPVSLCLSSASAQ